MLKKIKPATPKKRMSDYRERLRKAGLRQVQIWVPDTRSPKFIKAAKQQALALRAHDPAGDAMQDFIDTVFEWPRT